MFVFQTNDQNQTVIGVPERQSQKRTNSLLCSTLLHGVKQTRARHQHAFKEQCHGGRRAMSQGG
jgi:hypothetical protein